MICESEATPRTLPSGFLESASRFPLRTALEVAGQKLSYAEVQYRSARLAATLQNVDPHEPALTAVFASRSATAYVGILGALMRGNGYVPLNPRFPVERNRFFLEQSEARSLIVDSEGEKTLAELIEGMSRTLTVLLPERTSATDWRERCPQHIFLGAADLRAPGELETVSVEPGSVAYVLFTSGSTGTPKGVQITHHNISHLLGTIVARHSLHEQDRILQFADLTFDPSVYDVFAAWECGACVCCPGPPALLNPASFLTENAITVFQTVPSNGLMMKRLGALKAGRFPSLRVTLFGGEALPMELCRSWQMAAPNSIIENLYGPTEMTINSMAYRWDNDRSPAECEDGIVPIGELLPGVRGIIADEALNIVPDGTKGELLLAGPQRSPGYLNDPERTAGAMVKLPSRSETYYRTGDLVSKPVGKEYYRFHGRIDFQIKVFGMRIELAEIEAALREATGGADVAAIGWPVTETGVGGVAAFVGGGTADPEQLKTTLRAKLPQQMVPREIRVLQELPLNANGKIDRLQLRCFLESGT